MRVMLPVHRITQRQPSGTTYICLSCRLRSRKREAHLEAAIDRSHGHPPRAAISRSNPNTSDDTRHLLPPSIKAVSSSKSYGRPKTFLEQDRDTPSKPSLVLPQSPQAATGYLSVQEKGRELRIRLVEDGKSGKLRLTYFLRNENVVRKLPDHRSVESRLPESRPLVRKFLKDSEMIRYRASRDEYLFSYAAGEDVMGQLHSSHKRSLLRRHPTQSPNSVESLDDLLDLLKNMGEKEMEAGGRRKSEPRLEITENEKSSELRADMRESTWGGFWGHGQISTRTADRSGDRMEGDDTIIPTQYEKRIDIDEAALDNLLGMLKDMGVKEMHATSDGDFKNQGIESSEPEAKAHNSVETKSETDTSQQGNTNTVKPLWAMAEQFHGQAVGNVELSDSRSTRPESVEKQTINPMAFVQETETYLEQDAENHDTSKYRPFQWPTHARQASAADNSATIRPTTFFLGSGARQQARLFHMSSCSRQQPAAAMKSDLEIPPPPPRLDEIIKKDSPIRVQLRQWQELHGHKESPFNQQITSDDDATTDGVVNSLTRLPPEGASFRDSDAEEEEERQALASFMQSSREGQDSGLIDSRFLQMGDLVELDYQHADKDSVIAVFVRRLGSSSQFYTMHGRWTHLPEREVQYSIPGWISPDLVSPLLPYLPDAQSVQDRDELREQAYMYDLAVPRSVAAGLVSRMVQFHAESLEIYRRHAGALDSAHSILAHDTDLRYGSLTTAATTLLKTRRDDLPITALYTVRKALARAGFAFNIDRRSHRLTGYLQIRSKEQVAMVDQVRGWIRDWQDDMAHRAAWKAQNFKGRPDPSRTPKTALYVYEFLAKAKSIIHKSRENRDVTKFGSVGPSKKHFPITPTSNSIKVTTETQFTHEDTELVRFMEGWACSSMFRGLAGLTSLPPLLLQATGMYEDQDLTMQTGYVFLQELGTIMPFENRVRFDPHLLLPSSQHSKPLQNLMSSVMAMRDRAHFADSMAHLRHDWKNLPVYCIDSAGAQEIDDGISIERAGLDQWWVRVHIANPTAFFEKDHDLARMARHMAESIYMPERAYMMLPGWATKNSFSLDGNRPCLTFSVKMDADGNTLDQDIRPGILRKVLRLTRDEVAQAIGVPASQSTKMVLTVGGEVPPPPARPDMSSFVGEDEVYGLKMLSKLAEKRSEARRRAGGVFFDMRKPDVDVWETWRLPGLGWSHPYRKGSRTVEGDPVIRIQTQPMVNWFQTQADEANVLVREMMLLACETAASWCSQRQIPSIFRGSTARPDTHDPAELYRDVLEPAARASSDGSFPLHLGVQYLYARGGTALKSTAFKHALLGMDYYGKVTSPLRRYGDMIFHWQIEAALREEARTGQSLITQDSNADRSFLPFSRPALETIMLGLQPRETIISRAKAYAEEHWVATLMFRAFAFKELELPFYTEAFPTTPDGVRKPLMRHYIHSRETSHSTFIPGFCVDLNFHSSMLRPDKFGLGEVQHGDVWECEIERVDVYYRRIVARPIRLHHREPIQVNDLIR